MTNNVILSLDPLKNRAARYRAQAFSALYADSSLSVRLKRYNKAIAKARALEALAANKAARVTPQNTPNNTIQIIHRGSMWHILQGGITRAFATSYRAAQHRAAQLTSAAAQGGAL